MGFTSESDHLLLISSRLKSPRHQKNSEFAEEIISNDFQIHYNFKTHELSSNRLDFKFWPTIGSVEVSTLQRKLIRCRATRLGGYEALFQKMCDGIIALLRYFNAAFFASLTNFTPLSTTSANVPIGTFTKSTTSLQSDFIAEPSLFRNNPQKISRLFRSQK